MRRMIILLTIAVFMTLGAVLSASAVFADPLLPGQAYCGIETAESNAPDQADAHIPETEQGKCPDKPIKPL